MTGATGAASEPRELSRFARWCLVLGTSLLVLFATVLVVAIAGLAVGIGVGWWIVVPAIAAQVWFTVAAWCHGAGAETSWIAQASVTLAVAWLAIVVAGVASQVVTDHSVDGRHYHSETTFAIADGWNPLRDAPLFPSGKPVQPDSFAKGQAITAAVVLDITGSIDSTRLVGAMLLLAAALTAIAALEAAGAGMWLALLGGLVLASNPVALAQLETSMVDGVVSSLLLACIALGLLWVWRHPPFVVLPAFAGALVLLVNTKFTGLVHVGLIVGPVILLAGLLAGLGRKLVPMLAGLALATVVAMVAIGYNPYVTNTMRHDNPLHPVYGPDSREIGALYLTPPLRKMSDPERLVRSVLGESAGTSTLSIKAPLTFSTAEWSSFRSAGPRFGGFGPWFSAGILLAIAAAFAALIALIIKKEQVSRPAYTLLGVAVICIAVTLVQPFSFVARFAPQLWFVPPLVAIAAALAVSAVAVRVIAWIALSILFLDAVGVAGAAAAWSVRNTHREEKSLALLRKHNPLEVEFGSWRSAEARRLRENGVQFGVVKHVTCPRPFILSIPGSLERHPLPGGFPSKAAAVLCPVNADAPSG